MERILFLFNELRRDTYGTKGDIEGKGPLRGSF